MLMTKSHCNNTRYRQEYQIEWTVYFTLLSVKRYIGMERNWNVNIKDSRQVVRKIHAVSNSSRKCIACCSKLVNRIVWRVFQNFIQTFVRTIRLEQPRVEVEKRLQQYLEGQSLSLLAPLTKSSISVTRVQVLMRTPKRFLRVFNTATLSLVR